MIFDIIDLRVGSSTVMPVRAMRCVHLLVLLATNAGADRSWVPKCRSSTRFAWMFSAHDTVDALVASPSREEVYAGSHDGNIYAINTTNGHLLWNQTRGPVMSLAIDAGGQSLYTGLDYGILGLNLTLLPWNFTAGSWVYTVASSPSGDTVYVGSGDSHVYALRASDGHPLWNSSAGNTVYSVASSPLGDTVYVGSGNSHVYALWASDGKQLWNFSTSNKVLSVASSPLGDAVYAGSSDSNVYALRASDGHLLWNFTAGHLVASVTTTPSGDTVYVGSGDSHVYALRASDGHPFWNFTAGNWVYSLASSPSGDAVYVGSGDSHVYALRVSDGHPLWNFSTGNKVLSVALNPSGDTVYAGSGETHLFALRASDGQQLWNFTAGSRSWVYSLASSPSGDSVYVGPGDKSVYVLRASDGHQLWNFPARDWVYFVAASPSGDMMYVGAGNTLLAVNSHLPNGIVRSGKSASRVEHVMTGEHIDRLYVGYRDGAIVALSQDSVLWSFRRGLFLDFLSVSPDGVTAYAGVDRGFCKLNVSNIDGQQLWITAGNPVYSVASSPSGDTVYAAGSDSNVHALRASDGHHLWNFSARDWVYSVVPNLSGDTVYAASRDRNVYALRSSDGHQLWNFIAVGWVVSVASNPSVHTVYAGSADNNVYALRSLDGQQLWNFTAGNAVFSVASSPSGDTVYAGSADNVYALRALDGQQLWNVSARNTVWGLASSPSGDTVYAGSADNNVYALRASDGYQLWNFSARNMMMRVASSPSGDTVYAGSIDNNMYALRASDGHQLWSFTAGNFVYSVASSPSGDTVYAGLADGSILAFSECILYTKSRITSTALDPSGDVVYAGSIDHNVYAFNASTDNQLWNCSTQGGVTSVALDPLSNTVYAGSYDHNIYAIDASNGSVKWIYMVDSVVRHIAVSPDGNFIYAGSDNFTVFALYANKELKSEEVDWERIFLWAGTAAGGLAILLGLGVPHICTQSHVVQFLFAGTAYGSALGILNGYVMIKLPKQVPVHTPLFAKDHDERRWLVQDPRCYGLFIVISGVVMGMLWGLMAYCHRLLSLTHLCSALLLVSTLLAAYNLVPGLWLAHWPKPGMYLGSRPEILVAWFVCSYFVGLVCLLLGLAMLEVLYKVLERGRRTWRGHVYTRGLVLLPAFHWGFLGFWVSTITVLFCFGQHGKYVPPYSPLCVLGVGAGLLAFGIHLVSSPRDEHGWARDRARELASYVTWWPWAREPRLRRKWKKWTADVYPELHLRKVVQICMNAWCPAWTGFRQRLSTWTSLPLTSARGCQSTVKDELTWSLMSFTATSLLAVMPLVVYWFYARFLMMPPQTMSLQRPYCSSTQGIEGPYEQIPTLPIPTVGDRDSSYSPMIFEGDSPFSDCRTRADMERAVDPGDFNLCLNETASNCLLYGCEWPKCTGITDAILPEASSRTWSNVELAVYAGFLLVCMWAIAQEADEKVHVWAALKLNRLFNHGGDWRHWHWWTRSVIVPAFLWMLAAVYAACLFCRHASQTYFIFSDPGDLQQLSRQNVSMYGPERGVYALGSAMGATLIWYCDQGAFGAGPPSVLKVLYSDGDTMSLPLAVVQGLYFLYQCYSLVSKQRKLYDFVDGDAFMGTDSPQSSRKCSYKHLHEIRDRGDIMSRAEVGAYLQRTVYGPFIREAYIVRPDVVQSLFNEEDVERLFDADERGETVIVAMGDEKVEESHLEM